MPKVVDGGPQKATDNPEKASPKFDEEIGVQSTDKISGEWNWFIIFLVAFPWFHFGKSIIWCGTAF